LAVSGGVAAQRRERFRWHWLALAVIFALLSLDEQVSIHERAMWPMRKWLDPSGIFFFGWVIPAMAGLVVLGVAYFKFLLHLPRMQRAMFMLSATVYLGGALGMEMIGGAHASRWGAEGPTNALLTSIEEMLEIAGLILFVYALLDHLRARWGELSIVVGMPLATAAAMPPTTTTVEPHPPIAPAVAPFVQTAPVTVPADPAEPVFTGPRAA
jgi:hypothetical protein